MTFNRCWFFFMGVVFLPASLHSAIITLDWNLVTWTPGNLSQSFDIDPSNPGNDVTITVSGDISRIAQPISGTTLITGGVSPTNKTLQFVTDYTTNLESIVVKIDFNYFDGVSGLSYILHDIDGNQADWHEEVRGLFATSGGPNFAPTQIAALNATPTFQSTIAGLSSRLTGTGLADDNTNTGSVSIAFDNQVATSTSFRFGASTVGTFDPIPSGISLGTLTYTNSPVPEPTSAMLLLSALSLAGLRRRVKM